MGADAETIGAALMLVTVYSIVALGVDSGATSLVLYNVTFDNGTKPPVVGGIKSFDVAENDTEGSSV